MTDAQARALVALVVEAAAKVACPGCFWNLETYKDEDYGAVWHRGLVKGLPIFCGGERLRALATDEALIRRVRGEHVSLSGES